MAAGLVRVPGCHALNHSPHAAQRHQVTIDPAQLSSTKELDGLLIIQLEQTPLVNRQQTRQAKLLSTGDVDLGIERHEQVIFPEPVDE